MQTSTRVGRILATLAALVILHLSPFLMAQAVNGTLLGTVTDTSGATVTGAKVQAKSAETGAVHESVTNESGNFSFPNLQPGTYAVSAEANGFKRVTQQSITLLSNSSVRVDLSLTPGSVSETVTVTTAPPLLQTDRADISTKIDAANMAEIAPHYRTQLPVASQPGPRSQPRNLPALAVLQCAEFFADPGQWHAARQ